MDDPVEVSGDDDERERAEMAKGQYKTRHGTLRCFSTLSADLEVVEVRRQCKTLVVTLFQSTLLVLKGLHSILLFRT